MHTPQPTPSHVAQCGTTSPPQIVRIMQPDAAQLPLFESSDTVLVDDERGRVTVALPGLVESGDRAPMVRAAPARRCSGAPNGGRCTKREVDVPRLIAHFRLGPSPVAIPAAILDAARLVTDRVGAPFNSVGLNLYRDGRRQRGAAQRPPERDSPRFSDRAVVAGGDAADDDPRQRPSPSACFTWTSKPAACCVMDYATQLHYTHAVPKTPQTVGRTHQPGLSGQAREERSRPAVRLSDFYR